MARDERLAEREVDVVLPREIDGVEPATASTIRPGPTSIPTSRRTRPKVTTWRTIAVPCTRPTQASRSRARFLDEAGERLVPNGLDVLAVLEHRAERLLDDLRVDLFPAERGERLRPVDRLRDARRLREVEPAQPADERGRLGREPLRDPGTRSFTISISRSIDGCPIQWKSGAA